MAKKDEFDKIDTNKDGFISREEFDAADESAGIERSKLNWFLRLITLGDRFDIKDFWDRVKKSIVESDLNPKLLNDARKKIKYGT